MDAALSSTAALAYGALLLVVAVPVLVGIGMIRARWGR